jgi:hypothetical protein
MGKKWAITRGAERALYGMASAKVHRKSVSLFAEAVGISRTQTKYASGFVLGVHAVRAPRLERHDLGVHRLRSINRRHTPTGERVQRIECVRSRVSGTSVVGVLHLQGSGRQRAY